MTSQKNQIHRELVELWISQNFQNLSPDQRAEFFESAFEVIIRRTLKTLSSVTLQVVLDRVLFQGREKFPLLSDVKIEAAAFKFEPLIRNLKIYSSDTVTDALSYLLIELLGVIGTLTADILTEPLHKELLELTIQKFSSQIEQDSQGLRQINSGRKTEKA